MKIGRNDPCYCGSEKKYKKCCIDKPEMTPSDDIAECFDDSYENNYSSNAILSEADACIVEDWWEKYNLLHDTVAEREHVVDFIEKYPHLVDHLELHWEVLFEIGYGHYKKGIYDVFVDFLLRIRKDFPETYKESQGFYDADMIYWAVANGQANEIDKYFDFFREDGGKEYNDKLFNIVDYLRALNHSDILINSLANSECREFVEHTIQCNATARYVDKPVTDESVAMLVEELLEEDILESTNKENLMNEWREYLQWYQRPFTVWNTNLPKKKEAAAKYYLEISYNFAYFLYKKTELSFDSANYYSEILFRFYKRIVSEKKISDDDIFFLDKENIRKHSFIGDWYLFDFGTEYLAQLNAFYYFALYLKTCGNISEEKQQEIQNIIAKIFQESYGEAIDDGPEKLSFKNFPLWETTP